MPPYTSPLFRLRLSALGEDLSSWGDPNLNNAFYRIEEAVASILTLTITGDRVLTADNFVANEYRRHALILTGTPAANFTITVPAISYPYRFVNRTGKQATIKTVTGAAAIVRVGATTTVLCDGTDCTALDATLDQIKTAAGPVNLGGFEVQNAGAATSDTGLPNRGQVLALTAVNVQLASDWAQKTSATVDGTEYSAKLWATSTTALTGGNKGAKGYAQDAVSSASNASTSAGNAASSATLAQSWATSTTVVSGGFKGAYGYAQDAAASAAAAASAQAVTGPASAVADNFVLFNGTTGKIIKDGGLKVGTGANNLVQLDGSSRLPAVDASQLVNTPSFRPPDFIAEDQKPNGTSGGTDTTAGFTTRVLNTAVRNIISGASLSANAITLPAGSYYCEFDTPAQTCAQHKARLYNVTGAATQLVGSNEFASYSGTGGSRSYGFGSFTTAATRTLRVDHYRSDPSATDGLGKASSSGEIEVYSRVRIWKTA